MILFASLERLNSKGGAFSRNNFSWPTFAAWLVTQDRANGLFLICEKSFVRKTKRLLRLTQAIKRKDMREKPVRWPFCLTAIKPRKRFKALRKSFVRKALTCSTG
jgi:hypothetical protein